MLSVYNNFNKLYYFFYDQSQKHHNSWITQHHEFATDA